MMTMLLGGLWHGIVEFRALGFVHGLLLIVHRFGKDISFVKRFFSASGALGFSFHGLRLNSLCSSHG